MNTHVRTHSPSCRAVLTAWLVLAALVPGSAGRLATAYAGEQAAVATPAPAPATAAQAPATAAAPAAATTAETPAPATAPTTAVTTGAGDLNFDLLDEGKKTDTGPSLEEVQRRERIERLVKIRRPLLIAHQAVGFVTLAALAATVVIGHLNYYDKYQSGDFSGRYEKAHIGLGISTSITFGATGLLAVFAPNPYPKPIRFDTALVHKLSMILATAGMVTQIILGPITANRVGRQDQGTLALAHVVTGYATWAFMATGTVAYFF